MNVAVSRRLLLGLWRAGVIVALAWMMRREQQWSEAQKLEVVTLVQARLLFPKAATISVRDLDRGGHYVFDSAGKALGYAISTLPEAKHLIGYSGPNQVLIGLNATGEVAALELLASGDTADHFELVKRDERFLRAVIGWNPATPLPPVDAVSGATLTSSAILEGIEWRLAGRSTSVRFPEPLTLPEIRSIFPGAARTELQNSRLRVLDENGKLLGFAVRTSPWSDNTGGKYGPTESLVALRPDGKTVAALRIRKSYDTPEYVTSVREDDYWMKEIFIGKSTDWLAKMDYERDKIEGVSGATETSWAMAEGLKLRFAAEDKSAAASGWKFRVRDWGLMAVIAVACVLAFTNLRGHKWIRLAWQAVLMGYVGWFNGDLLSLGLMVGWAQHGLAWRAVPGLALLLAVSLLVPWGTRRQLYCHQICPHGAAQQWLGTLSRRRWRVPKKVARILESIPLLLLGVGLVAAIRGWPLDLGKLEPFDAWVWRAASTTTISIAVLGLLLSLRVPQAYCRYGCPTGKILEIVRTHGRADTFSKQDWLALGLLIVVFFARRSIS